jgi:Zn-dependent protease
MVGGLFDLTPQILALRIAALLLIAAVHGYTVAIVAKALGDPGPQQDGRLTVNPLGHLSVLGGIGLVVFSVGWIRPVRVEPKMLRGGPVAVWVVILAGLLAVLTAYALIDVIAEASLSFALVNLLPVPPLTGGLGLSAAMPLRRAALERFEPVGAVLLFALAATGWVHQPLASAYRTLSRIVFGS